MNLDLPLKDAAPSQEESSMTRLSWIALFAVAIIAVCGINFVEWIRESPMSFPDPRNFFNAFFVVTAHTEPAGLYLLLGFCILVAVVWMRGIHFPTHFLKISRITPRVCVLGAAFISFAISAAGTWLVALNHPLSADENMADFQAKIFLSGKLQAEIPEKLQFAAPILKPIHAVLSQDGKRWNQSYLPVYAAMRTPFLALNLQTLLNPLLGALTIIFLAKIIAILWPDKPWLSAAGAFLAALAPQILMTNMTSYSMPAHLALNTFWLCLFLQPQKRGFWLTPIIGVLAIGLHSPFVHALFVAPFLTRLLLKRQWKVVAVFGPAYLAGSLGWWSWWKAFAPGNAGSPTALLSWDSARILHTQPLNFLNLISWGALPMSILILVALRYFRSLHSVIQDGLFSCLLTFCFYALIPFDQGLGWGNRYGHGVLGCLVLLAVAGLEVWLRKSRDFRPTLFLGLGLALTLFISVPMRCWQVNTFVRPYAVALKKMQVIDADAVVYNPRETWYSTDLRRNDPFLTNRPLIINGLNFTPETAQRVEQEFKNVAYIPSEVFSKDGLHTTRLEDLKK